MEVWGRGGAGERMEELCGGRGKAWMGEKGADCEPRCHLCAWETLCWGCGEECYSGQPGMGRFWMAAAARVELVPVERGL